MIDPAAPVPDALAAFVEDHGADAFRRDGGPEHVTASCFVFSPDLDSVLLCFHRKGRFWVQFGGHVEPEDRTLAAAALREAREESGIADLELLTDAPSDVDRHELHGGFVCTAHRDVGHVAVVDPDTTTVAVSPESEDVRWFPVDALPPDAPAGLCERVGAARTLAASRRAP